MNGRAPRTAAMLRAARAEAGLTQAAVAQRVGRSKASYVDMERGKVLPPNTTTTIRLARVLGIDATALEAVTLQDRNSSAAATVPGSWFEYAAEGLLGRHLAPPSSKEVRRAKPMSYRDIERSAESLAGTLYPHRVQWGESIPVIDALMNCERISHVLNLPVRLVSSTEAGLDHEGRTESTDDGVVSVVLREDVWRRASSGEGRSRFSAGHELAHGVLHHQLLTEQKGLMFRDQFCTPSQKIEPGMKIYESPEYQANCWSAAFLMPTDAVRSFLQRRGETKQDCGVEDLAHQFQVSQQAASIRLSKILPKLAGGPSA